MSYEKRKTATPDKWRWVQCSGAYTHSISEPFKEIRLYCGDYFMATIWENGDGAVWHTWDTDGVGGENSQDPDVFTAMVEVEKALVRQGWVP